MNGAECRVPKCRVAPPPRECDADGRASLGTRHSALGTIALVAVLLFAPTLAQACPVCFGDPNAPMQKGVNNGIFVLLGIIGFVQIGFVALFWSFWKRARDMRRRREQLRLIEGGVRG